MIPKKTLQVNRKGVSFFGSKADLEKMRRAFARHHYLVLPHFLEPDLLASLHEKIREGAFFRKIHKDIANELCLRERDATRLLRFIINDHALFRWVETLTGCEKIGCFTGRIYRMRGKDHHDKWHNDMTQARMVGMSINLSERKYEGGHLILRARNKSETERMIRNTGFGSAVLFRLSYDLEHRIMDVTGDSPKTAYAGWYRAKPDFFKTVKNLRKRRIKRRKRHA